MLSMTWTYSFGMPLPMTCAWRVMGARMLASFTFRGGSLDRSGAMSVAVLDGGSWSASIGRGPRGSLKACVRRW